MGETPTLRKNTAEGGCATKKNFMLFMYFMVNFCMVVNGYVL